MLSRPAVNRYYRCMSTLPVSNPLVANSQRQAHASIAGYIYQIEQSLLRWINLRTDEALFLEGVEDCDVYSSQDQSSQAWQFKARADSISLGRAEIIETLNNFWATNLANPAFACELRYVTTSAIVVEQNEPFGAEISGITVWQRAVTNAADAEQIRLHLLRRTDLTPQLADFLRDAEVGDLQAKLLGRITWTTTAPTSAELEREIKRQLVHLGEGRSFLAAACDATYPALFKFTCNACTRGGARRLTREDFLREFDEAARVHRENALIKRQILLATPCPDWSEVVGSESGRGQFAAIDRTDFNTRIEAASQPLLSWPATLPNGAWLPRPEYDRLVAVVTKDNKSTTLLLGEPGSGKSALLSRLAAHCRTLPNTLVFAIKADALPFAVASPDDILPAWSGSGLARWLAVFARAERVVVLVDQLDAVAEIMDRRTARLNVLLSLMGALANQPGIHLVASCRPFEFEHDTRLHTVEKNQKLVLQPVASQPVEAALAAAGHQLAQLTEASRKLLSNPWNLSVYLRHSHPGEEISSLSIILTRIWSERILGAQAPVGTMDFLRGVAVKIRDEEELWIPIAIADRNQNAYRYLLSEEILVESANGLRFGFRHQSLFDYALLREFQSAAVSLADYIWQRQDGLFVRPTLLAALRHLRATARTEYVRELRSLLHPPRGRHTRFHVRDLLISFVGSQAQPLPDEVNLLVPLLRSTAEGPRVMRACAGSAGWFEQFALRPAFRRWLDAPPARAGLALGCVSLGFTVAEPIAARLVTRHWLPRPSCHGLILRALWHRSTLGAPSLRILTKLAETVPPGDLSLILDEVQKSSPSTVGEMLRLSLARQTRKAIRQYRRSSDKGFDALKSLLERDLWGHWATDTFAAEFPRDFMTACWPSVARVLPLLVKRQNVHFDARYPDSEPTMTYPERYGHAQGLLHPMMEAARSLAVQHPSEFLSFARSAEAVDHMFAQRLVAQGFLRNVSPLKSEATAWLLADRRRLDLTNFLEGDDTVALLHTLATEVDAAGLAALESAALNYVSTPENFHGDTLAERQEYAAYKTQRRRAQLLRALPRAQLSPPAAQSITQAEAELGEFGINPIRSQGGFVGALVNEEELATFSDPQFSALLAKLPDSTNWENPERRRFIDSIATSGGAIQQSRVLGVVAKKHPARTAVWAPLIIPSVNEYYAGELLGGLAASDHPTDEVLNIFRDFCHRGFATPEFKVRAAGALEVLAKRGAGLPDDAIDALLDRLDEFPARSERAEKDDSDEGPKRSILFGQCTWAHTDSSSQVMSAITAGILRRADANCHTRMLAVLERVARKPRSDFFWGQCLLESHALFASLPAEATAFLIKIVRKQPRIARLTPGRLAISHAAPFLRPDAIGKEIVGLCLASGHVSTQQFAGELAFLVFGFHQTKPNRNLLRTPRGLGARHYARGLTFAAVHFLRCPDTRDESRRIIAAALAGKTKSITQAALGFVRALDFQALDSADPKLVRAFLRLDSTVTEAWVSELVEKVAAGCDVQPKLATEVCQHLLDTAEDKLGDFRGGLSLRQGELINIALTVHRLPEYRQQGIEMFEQMLQLNLRELHDALKHLDNRQSTGG